MVFLIIIKNLHFSIEMQIRPLLEVNTLAKLNPVCKHVCFLMYIN
jgi:hypothetical protein